MASSFASMMQNSHEGSSPANGASSSSTTNGAGSAPAEGASASDPGAFFAPALPPLAGPGSLNLEDDSSFPTLGNGGVAGKGKGVGGPTWGTGSARLRTPVPSSRPSTPSVADEPLRPATASTTFQLPTNDIHVQPLPGPKPRQLGSSREPEPTTLGEVMKLVMKKYPLATVEASTSKNVTTFIIKGKVPQPRGVKGTTEQHVEAAKRELLGRLARKVSTEVMVPASLRPFIIGAKGRTLKAITDSTGANIQIPNRDADEPAEEADSDVLIPVTVSGDSSSVASAKAQILEIVRERTSKTSVRIDSGIPLELYPLLSGPKGSKLAALVESVGAAGLVTTFVPRLYEKRGGAAADGEEDGEATEKKERDMAITVSGDKEAVERVVEAIHQTAAELKSSLKTMTYQVHKRQHRFLIGANAEEILEATECSIELPPIEDKSETVVLRGPQKNLVTALQLLMEKVNETTIETLDLSTAHRSITDAKGFASNVVRYVRAKGKFRALTDGSDNVQIFLPRPASIEAGAPLIEIVGKDAAQVAKARTGIIAIVRTLPPAVFGTVDVDPLVHRHLIGKKGQRIKTLEEKYNVEVVFPPDGEDRSDVLVVYTGESAATAAAGAIGEAVAEIEKLAKDAADIATETLSIPRALHSAIIGERGTTLNAIIGPERTVMVRFGSPSSGAAKAPQNGTAKAKGASDAAEDEVVVRGPSDEVQRVKKELLSIAEDARKNEIVNSHVAEFEIETEYVKHVVGKAGAGVNKLRDDLGVRIDFVEIPPPAAVSGKKKPVPKSTVTIKGRKENVEEAKKRVLSQYEKLADEATYRIPLPANFERGTIIGKQGVNLKRLETTYEVRINIPKDSRKAADDESEAGDSNEIVIRGPKKGAEAAKKEIVDLMEYEKEHGFVASFEVTVKSLPRILGRGGATITEIKEDSGVSVDVDQDGEQATSATISIKGTKTGVNKAKAAILAIAQEVDDETTVTLDVPKALHTTLIGSGGAAIRDLIQRSGGPDDSRQAGNMVRFPRPGEDSNTVTVRAPSKVAKAILAALTAEVGLLQSRIIYGVVVPRGAHAGIVGKGAAALQDFQRTHSVKVVMPGWKEYDTVGEISNPDDVADGDASTIIKLVGPKEACVAAAEALPKGKPTTSNTVEVPRKFHARIAQGGRFFRSLPNGTRISHAGQKPPPNSQRAPQPPAKSAPAGEARIDDEGVEEGEAGIDFQLVALTKDDADDSTIPWVIESTSDEDLRSVTSTVEKAVRQAQVTTHIAWVTVPRALMPRIVGRGGSGLDKLRSFDVEVDVVGRRDSNQLTLSGSPDAIEAAHQDILRTATAPARQPRQRRDDY